MKAFRRLGFAVATFSLAVFATPASGTSAGAVDWPQFHFNPGHTGFNALETTISSQNVKFLGLSWQAQLGSLVISSSPAVVGDVVYVGTYDGRLWAYPADGCGSSFCATPLWTSTSLAQIIDSPTVANGIVYVGSQTDFNNNDGKLNAFDANGCGQATCAPLWQGLAGAQSILESSPYVAGGRVFIGAFDGRLYVFDANGCGQATCQPLWTGQMGSTTESTPVVYRGTVFIGADDGKLYAFKAAGCGQSTCSPVWTGFVGSPIFQISPTVANGLVFIAGQHTLAAFPAAGCGQAMCNPTWKSVDNLNFFGGSPAVAKGKVYIGLENGLAAYAAAGCGQLTCNKLFTLFGTGEQAAVLSSPAVANGVVYAGRNTGQILAWAATCGSSVCNEIWGHDFNESIVSSSPAVVNGTVYIGSADNQFPEEISGRLYVFELGIVALAEARARVHKTPKTLGPRIERLDGLFAIG